MSCWVQPAGMFGSGEAEAEAAGEAEAAAVAAADAAAEAAGVAAGGVVAAPGVAGAPKLQAGTAAGAQAATLTATRPPPVRPAARRKPRRVIALDVVPAGSSTRSAWDVAGGVTTVSSADMGAPVRLRWIVEWSWWMVALRSDQWPEAAGPCAPRPPAGW